MRYLPSIRLEEVLVPNFRDFSRADALFAICASVMDEMKDFCAIV